MPIDTRILSAFGLVQMLLLGNSNGWTHPGTNTANISSCYCGAIRRRWGQSNKMYSSSAKNHQSICSYTHQKQRQSLRASTIAAAATVQNQPLAPGLPKELEKLNLFEPKPLEYNNDGDEVHGQTVERVSMDPPIFIFRKALTPKQCRGIRQTAFSMVEMEQGKTNTCKDDNDEIHEEVSTASDQERKKEQHQKHPRRFSNVGWLSNEMPMVEQVARNGHGVFLNGMPFHSTRGIEPLQVVHYYDVGGEYINHHDSNNRLLTLLYYLNGVGETWFPLADNHDVVVRDSREASLACRDKSPDRDGVLVTCRRKSSIIERGGDCGDLQHDSKGCSGPVVAHVEEGDAVAFYNFNLDGSMNWKAFHSGLPITETDLESPDGENSASKDEDGVHKNDGGKWIANHFFHFVPSHVPETPPPTPVEK